MEHLYAPWRSKYIRSHGNSPAGENGCPLCLAAPEDDSKKYVIKRYEHVYLMLNLYPYNAGHVMVVPYQHTGTLAELEQDARAELLKVAAECEIILSQELRAEGFNIGLNLGGKTAGGTIPEHIHLHVLPRFNGDTNFLPLLSETKQISFDLNDLYKKLQAAFNQKK